MKVKVGNTIYCAEETPLMIILSEGDKKNIINMDPKACKYASVPEDYFDNIDAFKEWMKTQDDK